MTKKIVQENGTCRRVSYLGHSLGTLQLFYGMARGTYMQSYYSQMVALSPCFIPGSDGYVKNFNYDFYAYFFGILEVLDIESLFGPNWDKQVNDLCNFLGQESEDCAAIKSLPLGPIAGGDIYGYSEVGVQELMHLG